MKWAYALACLMLLGALVAPSASWAQSPPAAVSRVVLDVAVIEASKEHTAVDPVLQPFLKTLQATPFTGFDLVRQEREALTDNQTATIDFGGGRQLALRLLSHDAGSARVQVRYLFPGGAPISMTLEIKRDRAFLSVLRSDSPSRALLLKVDVRS